MTTPETLRDDFDRLMRIATGGTPAPDGVGYGDPRLDYDSVLDGDEGGGGPGGSDGGSGTGGKTPKEGYQITYRGVVMTVKYVNGTMYLVHEQYQTAFVIPQFSGPGQDGFDLSKNKIHEISYENVGNNKLLDEPGIFIPTPKCTSCDPPPIKIPVSEGPIRSDDLHQAVAVATEIVQGFIYLEGGVLSASLGTASNDLVEGRGFILAGDGQDTVVGSESFDFVIGGDGNDHLAGEGGDDHLFGNQGHDTLIGGDGNDTLKGGDGHDLLKGGAGADVLKGGDGYDLASYEDRDHHIYANLEGGADASGDTYESIEGVIGTAYSDTITGNAEANILVGNAGNDTLVGGAGNDTLHGGDDNDTLVGGLGDDALYGEGGNNILKGGEGADAHYGAGGFSVASYVDATSAVNASLTDASTNTGEAAGDSYDSVNGLWGSTFGDRLEGNIHANWIIADAGNDSVFGGLGSDTLYGSTGSDVLDGGDDDDVLYGEDGDELLIGGSGADTIDGGEGFDTASYADANGTSSYGVIVNLGTGTGAGDTLIGIEGVLGSGGDDSLTGDSVANLLSGAAGHDGLRGESGNDTLQGGDGNDSMTGGAGADVLQGGAGSDTAVYATAAVGVTASLASAASNTGEAAGDSYLSVENLTGSFNADILVGDGGMNTLIGNGGNDLLSGGGSVDVVDGGSGNDTLIGGSGSDQLTGGTGQDLFVFNTALSTSGNVDRIVDFDRLADKIQLSASVFGGLAAGTLSSAAFKLGTTATTLSQRLIYDKAAGNLSFDADGSGAGAAIKFATLAAGTELTADHFVVAATITNSWF